MEIAAGAVIAGKYELERPLARGGMGAVWVARHVKLGSRLAVKFLDPRFASAPAFIDRFEREARAAAALHNPHVVHVQDYGLEGATPYIVMELLQGEDLETRLRRVRRLSLQESAHILVQIGKALRKAHDAGIVHRDLKPANLFLARVDDDEEVVKVLDFGIAKETAHAVGPETKTGEVMGSPHYMSPEQARADKGLDHRADLWAVGVILYRMVTGALPFTGEVLGAVLSRILVDPVPLVATVAPDLPGSLDFFFAKALAKVKEQRFQSVRELVEAFLEIAGGGRASLGSQVSFSASGSDIHVPPPTPATSSPPVVSGSPAVPGLPFASPGAPGAGASMSTMATVPLPATAPLPVPVPAGSAGPGTLTNASITQERASHAPAQKPRRSVAPWLAGGAVLLLLMGGIGYGVKTIDDPAPGSRPDPDTAEPAAVPTVQVIPADPPGRVVTPVPDSAASGGSIAPSAVPAVSGAPSGELPVAPTASAAEPVSPTATPTASSQKAVQPSSRPPAGQKPDRWGF
jgi:eukaryotic-like serine/threonine-protein kinase